MTNPIQSISFRQGTAANAPSLKISTLRVGTTWADVTPAAGSGGPTINSFSPTSGPAGTLVTITGTGFTGATGVNFAGVAASSFTVISDTQITATVPSAATTGAISVTTGSGTGVSTGSFTVPALTLSLSPTAVNEDAGPTASTGTVSINLALGADLTVSLSSGNTAAATVPASVTIPTGQTSVTFSVAAVPNPTSFSASTALISASASGHLSASASLTVNNVDSSYLELNSLGSAKVENFNGMASSGTADLPLGFKVGTDWNAGTLAATLAYGTAGSGAVTGSSSGGIINWGNGTNAASTDRALGFLTTGSYSSPRTIVVAIKNTTGSTINTLDISWNYEKYRAGTRAFSWTFKHGETSVPANTDVAGDQTYAADGANAVVEPPTTIAKTVKLANLNIPDGGIYYLSWTFAGDGGSTNAQGLAVDDLSVTPSFVATPALGLSAPSSINEGVQGQTGTVTIPQALETNLDVTVTSSLPSALTVELAGSATVTIPAGQTSNTFYIDTIADNQVTPDQSVTLTAMATGYLDATAGVTVKNIDLPRADFGSSGFTSDFSGFTNGSTLPLGWSISGNNVAAYTVWTNSTTGTKYNTNAPFLFGYKHTSSTGTVLQTLTLSNSTAETITALTVTYKGRVNVNDGDSRDPAYTVSVAGQASVSLDYSTSEGDAASKAGVVTGLNIAPGGIFSVVWSSDGPSAVGSGSRKTIGLSDVTVVAGVNVSAPTLGAVTVDPFTLAQTSATISGDVTGDGATGSLTERGLVYALSSVSNVVIDGVGVTKLAETVAEVGKFTNTVSGLTANTGYTVRAYAINSQGTNYSSSASFTTLQANPTFTGVYTQDFTGLTNSNSIPAGWRVLSSSNLNTFAGTWASNASSGGFYTRPGTPGILGYLHTASTGILTNKLTLVNGTGGSLTNLYVSYTGEVNGMNNTRFPAFTVAVNGTEVAELAYSTSDGTNAAKSTQLTGLNINDGDSIVITWVSDRGTGTNTSRLIGMTDVRVSTSAPVVAPSGLSYSPATINGFVGQPISSLTPTVTGTVDTYSVSPALPNGLAIDGTTGVISGTPLAATASATYTVTAANAGGSTTTTITVAVVAADPLADYMTSFGLSGPDAAGDADPDKDGQDNNAELAFGTDPTNGASRAATLASGTGTIKLVYLQRNSGVTYTVKSFTDLSTSFDSGGTVVTPTATNPQPGGVRAGYTQYEASLSTGSSKGFLRVKAVR